MITPFYRHGIMLNKESMAWLARRLDNTGRLSSPNNEGCKGGNGVVASGLALAEMVWSSTKADQDILLVGHSHGGLVCRVAAVALAGKHLKTYGPFTDQILNWRCNKEIEVASRRIGVVTIATPNAGALTFGQMSVTAELLKRTILKTAALVSEFADLEELTTPKLFLEFENWRVDARYLSISGVCVNRYNRGWVRNLAEMVPIKRVSVRFDVPNDLVVEDSSTDLRGSLIRPEIDLTKNYRHVRVYPRSIYLDHISIREADEAAEVIVENLDWLVPVEA